jgi:DNA transformation protein and related proteins
MPESARRIGLLRNLGPQSERMLAEIGIHTEADLRKSGSAAAYRRLSFVLGRQVSRNLLWAMEGALRGCDWRELPVEVKHALLSATRC